MKLFVALLSVLLVSVVAGEEKCFSTVNSQCTAVNPEDPTCDARFSGFQITSGQTVSKLEESLQTLINKQLASSYDYLLLATRFNTYSVDRPGFHKLFRSLSDKSFDNTINLIKHVGKRGGLTDFKFHPSDNTNTASNTNTTPREKEFDVFELHALSKGLDIQKSLTESTVSIQISKQFNDPEINHYLEEELLKPQANTIRQLSGYVSDLWQIMKPSDGFAPLGLYLFDEYLEKQH